MLPFPRRGQQEENDEVDRPAIDRVEVDRLIEPDEQAEWLFHQLQAGVGNGGTVAHAGRAEVFALEKRSDDGRFIEAETSRRPLRQFMEKLAAVRRSLLQQHI